VGLLIAKVTKEMIDFLERSGNEVAVLSIDDLQFFARMDVIEGQRLRFRGECAGALGKGCNPGHAGNSSDQEIAATDCHTALRYRCTMMQFGAFASAELVLIMTRQWARS
jgi:hypothetical protein